jgi:hypothetical protein
VLVIRRGRITVVLVIVGLLGVVAGIASGALARVLTFGAALLLVLVIPLIRLRIRTGVRLTFASGPGKVLRSAPDDVDQALPKLVWVLRNREPARVRSILMDGPLLRRDNLAATAQLATWLSAALVRLAVGAAPDQSALKALRDEIGHVVAVTPVYVEDDDIASWETQLRGGEPTHRLSQPFDLTVTHLAVVAAIGAAAATMAGLDRAGIYDLYAQVRASWARRS